MNEPLARKVTYPIPEGTLPSECRGCGATIYFIRPKEKLMPVDPDGVPHFATCPKAGLFRRRRVPA